MIGLTSRTSFMVIVLRAIRLQQVGLRDGKRKSKEKGREEAMPHRLMSWQRNQKVRAQRDRPLWLTLLSARSHGGVSLADALSGSD